MLPELLEHVETVQTVCAAVGCASIANAAATWWKKRAPIREARRERRRARRAARRD